MCTHMCIDMRTHMPTQLPSYTHQLHPCIHVDTHAAMLVYAYAGMPIHVHTDTCTCTSVLSCAHMHVYTQNVPEGTCLHIDAAKLTVAEFHARIRDNQKSVFVLAGLTKASVCRHVCGHVFFCWQILSWRASSGFACSDISVSNFSFGLGRTSSQGMCADMCADTSVDMSAHMCAAICADMCADMCPDMSVDMCAGMRAWDSVIVCFVLLLVIASETHCEWHQDPTNHSIRTSQDLTNDSIRIGMRASETALIIASGHCC